MSKKLNPEATVPASSESENETTSTLDSDVSDSETTSTLSSDVESATPKNTITNESGSVTVTTSPTPPTSFTNGDGSDSTEITLDPVVDPEEKIKSLFVSLDKVYTNNYSKLFDVMRDLVEAYKQLCFKYTVPLRSFMTESTKLGISVSDARNVLGRLSHIVFDNDFSKEEMKSINSTSDSMSSMMSLVMDRVNTTETSSSLEMKYFLKFNSEMTTVSVLTKLDYNTKYPSTVNTPKSSTPTPSATNTESDTHDTSTVDEVDNDVDVESSNREFKLVLDLPDETLSGEATAYHDTWIYEGVLDSNAESRFDGTNLNKASKRITKAMKKMANDITVQFRKQVATKQVKDRAITWSKLSDNVKSRINKGSSGGGGGVEYTNYSEIIENSEYNTIDMNKLYNL